jgi:protein gp37
MAKQTAIQWTDATVNFWRGCKKVSPGCKFCYMYRDQERYGRSPEEVLRTSPTTFNQALKWSEPRRIFTNSWSDFFIEEADNWRDDAWNVIRSTLYHQWQILTKRPELIPARLPCDWGTGWGNVLLGVSVESQEYWSRADLLSKIPARSRFLSLEPLIGPIDVLQYTDGVKAIDSIDWVIIGGESGNENGKYRYRPCEIEWIEKIVNDLRSHAPHVKIFIKQLGTYQYHKLGLLDRHGGNMDSWSENLEHLQIREKLKF